MIAFRSPVTTALHPKRPDGAPRPPGDDFYVTQRYDDIDWYWSQRGVHRVHAAVDVGNWQCSYPVVAMADGVGRRVKDNATAFGAATDALGYIIDHGQGVTTECWHLGGWMAQTGQQVAAGDRIGIVGNTGLGAICHLHVEMKINGVRIDPEPYMFGKAYGQGDDMTAVTGYSHIHNRRSALTSGAHFRAGPTRASDSLHIFPAGEAVIPVGVTSDGEDIGGSPDWYLCAMWVAGSGKTTTGFFHGSVLAELTPIEQVGDDGAAWLAGRDAAVAAAAAVQR